MSSWGHGEGGRPSSAGEDDLRQLLPVYLSQSTHGGVLGLVATPRCSLASAFPPTPKLQVTAGWFPWILSLQPAWIAVPLVTVLCCHGFGGLPSTSGCRAAGQCRWQLTVQRGQAPQCCCLWFGCLAQLCSEPEVVFALLTGLAKGSCCRQAVSAR